MQREEAREGARRAVEAAGRAAAERQECAARAQVMPAPAKSFIFPLYFLFDYFVNALIRVDPSDPASRRPPPRLKRPTNKRLLT